MKSKLSLLMIFAAVSMSGCATSLPTGPLFCDVESPRRFTSAEIDARVPFSANLQLDLATNERGRDHCGWQ